MAARVFISYSHEDEGLRDQLEKQLSILKRRGLVEVWHDRRLIPGDHFDWTISEELDRADIILLLVSPDFLASDYCYNIEKSRALKRNREGTARLISVILRPSDWKHTDLAQYLVTPKDGKPVTLWPDRDEAFLDVTQSIRRAIEAIGKADKVGQTPSGPETLYSDEQPAPLPRSSNLRLKKEFTHADKDQFLLDAFEYMDRFFQGSLEELQKRNHGIQTRHRQIDGNCFTAVIYRDGKKKASCTIRLSKKFSDGITYSEGENASANSWNESLSVEMDDQKLFLRPMGMSFLDFSERVLSREGAAEHLWSMLIRPIQGG